MLMDLAEPVENADYNKLRRSLGLATLEPIDPSGVRVESLSPARQARLELINSDQPDQQSVSLADLIVVAEFKDYIYPGLVSTGKVARGGDARYLLSVETILSVEPGADVKAGDVLTVHAFSKGWWGEGDDMIFVDGEPAGRAARTR